MGAGGLNGVDGNKEKVEVGFWLFPENWGKGIILEVIPVICEYEFIKLGLHRIKGFIDARNEHCKKGLEKLNFVYEGRMVNCEKKNDNYISIDMYAKINYNLKYYYF